jgi:UDP-N-acetylglucosamine--N-acetylmuramyl-(pentapeptide) pyrophosphoryl-undecaprenol N-acetylglucosamine transferase
MRIIVSAGGSGGHVYPALGLIEKIKEDKNNEYLFVGTTDRMESKVVPEMNIPYESLYIHSFNKNIIKDIKNTFSIYKAYKKSKKIIKLFKPDVVVGFGGYVTFPLLLAAKKMKVKTAIHEQNYIPGKSNKILSKFTDVIFTSFEESFKYFDKKKVIYTGNPCSERAEKIKKIEKESLGFHKDKKFIIIVMGSLGSSSVSEKLKLFLTSFKDYDKEILYIVGKQNSSDIKNLIVPKNTLIVDYVENLPGLLKDADLVISRAGASTISELLALEIPSILLPSPYVANNHQYFNAKDLNDKHLSFMLEEKDLNEKSLALVIRNILDNDKMYNSYKTSLSKNKKMKSSTIMYKELNNLIKK